MRLLWKSCEESELENDMIVPPSAYANDRRARRTILLVEDEPFVREATRIILEHAGFEVLTAENTRDAMKVYEECNHGIDLVLTDMVLPGGTGEQLGQELRQRSAEIVVLVTSGYSDHDEMEAPEERTYFLAKPYSSRSLVEKIETILGAVPLGRAATQAS
jgi:two-component system cell cycle sensor histidine kinase/response regulator CckA